MLSFWLGLLSYFFLCLSKKEKKRNRKKEKKEKKRRKKKIMLLKSTKQERGDGVGFGGSGGVGTSLIYLERMQRVSNGTI